MNKRIAQVRAPSGFSWHIDDSRNDLVYINLVTKDTRKRVGQIRLYKEGEDYYETHSDLDADYRGRGFGAKLYARAIQWCLRNGYKVRSSGASSEDAQRVWRGKSIRKYFRVRTKKYEHNPEPGYDTFYAYRK